MQDCKRKFPKRLYSAVSTGTEVGAHSDGTDPGFDYGDMARVSTSVNADTNKAGCYPEW